MDAVGKEYEYIRHPLRWQTIDENFEFLLKNKISFYIVY